MQLEAKQNTTNASNARTSEGRYNNCNENTRPMNTTPFFVHCFGLIAISSAYIRAVLFTGDVRASTASEGRTCISSFCVACRLPVYKTSFSKRPFSLQRIVSKAKYYTNVLQRFAPKRGNDFIMVSSLRLY